ncbi:DUF397 domain-containing protein [Streptomyces cyaneofuscatus]|uniref:DUF397 domain-containing protein n=1 Tax=Streptomyces cyaneofuscatus TaxID=66883 RepID=UPI002954CE10|nr:DUF397 domain-containing protein [Streptomyces cyaneofuscatus]WOP11492.1 DUF397 domain-containing protein [Streptomyces cyaneofuscatus]
MALNDTLARVDADLAAGRIPVARQRLRGLVSSYPHEPAPRRRLAEVYRWRKSSYSGGANGDCLEVADGQATVPVRDSKTPTGPALAFSPQGWTQFVSAVKDGELSA